MTQQQIEEASLAMESQMELHELQESLKGLKENLEFLRSHAKRVDFFTYQKIKAAERAASAAVERIIKSERSNERQLPEKLEKKSMQIMRFRQGVSGPSKERSRACLRLVYCGRRV